MKKISKLLLTLLVVLSSIIIPPSYVKASDQNCFTVKSSSNSEYILSLSVKNMRFQPKRDIVYVGQELNSLLIVSTVKYNGNYCYDTLKWENPDYAVVNGEQDVNLLYMGKTETVVFVITINPINEPWRLVYGIDSGKMIIERYEGSNLTDVVPMYSFKDAENNTVKGVMSYANYEDLSLGYHEIGWTFTPTDTSYEIKTGIYKVNIIEKPVEADVSIKVSEEDTTLSLTAFTLTLSEDTVYDVNLENKQSGSTYVWGSNNKSVATVNKSGVVVAVSEGETEITCEVTNPDNETTTLSANVIVGTDDDNLPILSETDLSLEIGDLVDVDVENKISSCKYKWTSSNKAIAKVTSTSGKITGLTEGNATIYCTITTKDKEIIVLKCNVEVAK